MIRPPSAVRRAGPKVAAAKAAVGKKRTALSKPLGLM